MDIGSIIQFIESAGFPVMVCLCMMYYIKYLNDQHKQEMDKISDALNNNTIVMNKILDRLDKIDK